MSMLFTVLVVFGLSVPSAGTARKDISASLAATQEAPAERRVLASPGVRARRGRGDRPRGRRGIGSAYARAGRSAARGAKGLAKNVARGRVVRGGKEFGKGMGGFGKQTGIGTARVGKKVGKSILKSVKRAFTP